MSGAVAHHAVLDALFRHARTPQKWTDRPVSKDQLRDLYAIMKWGPTSFNGQPARVLFCRSEQARRRLAACASRTNGAKILVAPVTAIIAADTNFYQLLPELFPRPHAAAMMQIYRDDPNRAREYALRNSSLQGAYFIIAARAIGLDCGPMSGFDNEKVDLEFLAATGLLSNFICSIGYGDHSEAPPRGPRLDFERVCTVL